jgi:hypothetical protein
MSEIEMDVQFAALLELSRKPCIPLAPKNAYSKVLDKNGNWVAIHEWHWSGSDVCGGFVAFDTPEARAITTPQAPKWTVESWDPLTLSPSLLCRSCGNHGFIRQGRWESC